MIKLVKLQCPSCGGELKKKGFSTYKCPFCDMKYKMDVDVIIPVPVKTGNSSQNQNTNNNFTKYQQEHNYNRSLDDYQDEASKRTKIVVASLVSAILLIAVAIILIRAKAKSNSDYSTGTNGTGVAKVTQEPETITSQFFKALISGIFEKDYKQVTSEELAQITYLDLATSRVVVAYKINNGELKYVKLDSDLSISYSDLKEFTGLEVLYFSAYKQEHNVLSYLPYLVELHCHYCPGEVVKILANPEGLKTLDCDFYDGDLGELDKLVNLESLKIKYYRSATRKGDDPDLSIIAKLPKLETLMLDVEEYTVFPFIAELKNLKRLNIHSDELKDIGFLASLQKLEELTLVGADIISIDDLKYTPDLKVLRLEDCYKLDGFVGVEKLTNLEELMLSYSYGQKLPEDFSALTKLTTLTLAGFYDISFLSQLPTVKYLHLSCHSYSDLNVITCMTDLKELKIRGSAIINGLSFLKEMSSLEKVDFSGLKAGTDTEQVFLIPNIKEIDLSNSELAMDLNFVVQNDSLEVLKLDNLKWDAYNDSSFEGERIYEYKDWTDLPLTDCFSFLQNFPNLRSLSIEGNQLANIDFLAGMNSLVYLDITNNYIRDITVLNSLTSLETVLCGENTLNANSQLDSRINVNYESTAKEVPLFFHYDW